MEDAFLRGWQNFLERPSGPIDLRFFLQPLIASFFAIRAGVKDAKLARPAFLWTLMIDASSRSLLIHQTWKDIGKVFIVATCLDAIYQVIMVNGIFLFELIFTASLLAVVPYVLLRGPVNRICFWYFNRKVDRARN